MHQLIADLTTYLNLTPEQQFRVSAMIKRNIHDEKASVFSRYAMYMQGPPIFDRTDPENPKVIGHEPAKDTWIHGIMKDKAAQHREWAKKPDEEVITWSVGSFKYVQKIDPCSVCGKDLTNRPAGEGYSSIRDKNGYRTFCQEHTKDDE